MVDFAEVFARVPDEAVASTPGAGLALSGGGFRAMLFHAGALRRLHEVGALARVARVSSVSGGSIAAALVAIEWDALTSAAGDGSVFERRVQQPLFDFASRRLDAVGVLAGLATPRRSIAHTVSRAYDDLFGGATLADLPDEPRFVFCATNLGSGSLVRFAKPYTADYRIGKRDRLVLPMAEVVAASAAFPPVLSPMVIELGPGRELTERFSRGPDDPAPALEGLEPYVRRLELSDGGVYDNLGLQPVDRYHTVLVSDGGGPFEYEPAVPVNWLNHMIRAWKVTDNQVRALRRSALVGDYRTDHRLGTYWGVQSSYRDYTKSQIPVHEDWADVLKAVPTRLWPIAVSRRRQLVNWGYAVTDAALRTYVTDDIAAPSLPYPDEALHRAPPTSRPPWWRRLLGR